MGKERKATKRGKMRQETKTYSIDELAKLLRISTETIRSYVAAGKVSSSPKKGRSIQFTAAEVKKFQREVKSKKRKAKKE